MPTVTADALAAAAGITDTTDGPGYQLRDPYGVTYTGTPGHLVLAALARRDLTPDLYRAHDLTAERVRDSARLLAEWFTCDHIPVTHAAAFAALPPRRVCELVAHVASHSDPHALGCVGPESLPIHTGYLTGAGVNDPHQPYPAVIDHPYRALSGSDEPPRLDVWAAAPHGVDEVMVPVEIEAHEEISWEFTAPIPVPVDELNALLMDGGPYAIEDYVDEHRFLVDEYLTYTTSRSEDGISVTARLLSPGARLDYPDGRPAPVREVTLYFVGPDPTTAAAGPPLLDRAAADATATSRGHQVFAVAHGLSARELRTA
ncbi:hypothetical protein GCM10012275_42730 [Longimycelium tulufanense]|uniref:Uncharacterized protein n=1 Tax=Longimycelium tulufanense TaxID=907463 RepID=A0A8J3FY08_9PSEU|nr:hypothetical protein [Longimycelium tulufanense]GGM67619.1 hypothetical protein GCM10012275_42730 [Longimycelium tulufanense]